VRGKWWRRQKKRVIPKRYDISKLIERRKKKKKWRCLPASWLCTQRLTPFLALDLPVP
jgi:hypothetical protein